MLKNAVVLLPFALKPSGDVDLMVFSVNILKRNF